MRARVVRICGHSPADALSQAALTFTPSLRSQKSCFTSGRDSLVCMPSHKPYSFLPSGLKAQQCQIYTLKLADLADRKLIPEPDRLVLLHLSGAMHCLDVYLSLRPKQVQHYSFASQRATLPGYRTMASLQY